MASRSAGRAVGLFNRFCGSGRNAELLRASVPWRQLGSSHLAAGRGFTTTSKAHTVESSLIEVPGGVSLIQGSDRGIGLEFVEQLLSTRPEGRVIATCRDPSGADHLDALHDQSHGRLEILELDVTKEHTIEAAAKVVKEKYGRLDLLVNCAGILHIPNVLQPETSLRWLDPEAMAAVYAVNAMGPMLVSKHMLPLLVAGGGAGTGREAAVIANLSARVGSISDNKLGGWYSYRASKAALNQLTKTLSIETARKNLPVVSLLLHPGTVDTDLSKPFQRNVPKDRLFTRQYAVERLLAIIDGAGKKDNGKLFAWDGQEIPW